MSFPLKYTTVIFSMLVLYFTDYQVGSHLLSNVRSTPIQALRGAYNAARWVAASTYLKLYDTKAKVW